jgi:hypothetical protein
MGPTHNFKIGAFILVYERAGFTLKPLQLGAPITVFERFIAAIIGQFLTFLGAVTNLVTPD